MQNSIFCFKLIQSNKKELGNSDMVEKKLTDLSKAHECFSDNLLLV